MKRLILTVLLSGNCLLSAAQPLRIPMELVKEFSVGTGSSMIQFSKGPYLGSSPAVLTFATGNYLWIGEVDDGKLFDIHNQQIVQIIPYPTEDYSQRIRASLFLTFISDNLFVDNVSILRYGVTRSPFSIGAPFDYGQPEAYSRLYAIKDYIFFYDSDGFVRAVDSKRNMLSREAATALLITLLNAVWYSENADRDFHLKMIESRKYLIVEGVFYPRSGQQMLEYFGAKGVLLEPDLSERLRKADYSTPPEGLASNGDIYIAFTDGVYVVSQEGRTQAVIEHNAVNPAVVDSKYNSGSARNDVSAMLKAVHPNGDFYTLYAIKDDVARIHRAVKMWGNDFIGMARSGVVAGEEASTRKRLQGFSTIELRLLRNALFALHGYAFQSWDLTTYFRGYDWYAPDPKVKNDSGILSAEQKRLFDIVVGIEKQRVVTQ